MVSLLLVMEEAEEPQTHGSVYSHLPIRWEGCERSIMGDWRLEGGLCVLFNDNVTVHANEDS